MTVDEINGIGAENVAQGNNLAPMPQNEKPPIPMVTNVTKETEFTKAIDTAKINTVNEAYVNDKKFSGDFKEKLKEATLKLAEVEKQKAELERQNVEFAQEILETQQKLNKQKQEEDKWINKQKARQYHYDGVKDIMICLGIKNPMCIPLLYFMFPFAFIFYLIKCIFRATIGNLLFGAVDENRPQSMKNFLWILLIFVVCLVIFLGGYLIINWLHPFGWLV